MIEPKLRFKADDGSQFPDWEEKTLGDIGTAKMCKRVLKEQTSEKGDVPFYKIGTFGGTPDAFISRELYEELKAKYSFPRKGNILLSAAGTIGRTVVYDGQDAFFQDSNIVWLDNDDSVLDGFLLQFYNKTSWDNLEGGTIKRLYNGLFLSKVIHVPSLPEQQKIAEFLSTIDTVIAKQKETVSAWEERKKGVMQKLFSQEVRFKADDRSDFPDWEEKKFGDICAPLTYGMNTAAVKYDGENKYIRITDIDDESHLYKNNELVSPEGELDDKYLVSENDILLARTGASVGKSYLYDKKDGKLYYAGFLIKAHVKSENSKFIFYQTLTDRYARWVQVTSMRSGQPGINANEYSEFMMYVPCLTEQQKIADCLSSLDEVIEKQKATLAAWEELKKGLLQQMFV